MATTALLLALAAPVFELGLTPASSSLLPPSSEPRQVDETIKHNFAANPALPIAAISSCAAERIPAGGLRTQHLSAQAASPNACACSTSGAPPGWSRWRRAATPSAPQTNAWSSYCAPCPRPTGRGGRDNRVVRGPALEHLLQPADRARDHRAHDVRHDLRDDRVGRAAGEDADHERAHARRHVRGAAYSSSRTPGLGGVLDFRGNGGLEPSNLVLLLSPPSRSRATTACSCSAAIKEAHDAGLCQPRRRGGRAGADGPPDHRGGAALLRRRWGAREFEHPLDQGGRLRCRARRGDRREHRACAARCPR